MFVIKLSGIQKLIKIYILKIWKISDENEIDFHSLTLVWNDLRYSGMYIETLVQGCPDQTV